MDGDGSPHDADEDRAAKTGAVDDDDRDPRRIDDDRDCDERHGGDDEPDEPDDADDADEPDDDHDGRDDDGRDGSGSGHL